MPVKCNGCYNENKFVVWAVAVAAQAIVDGARIYPELKPLVGPAIQIFQNIKIIILKDIQQQKILVMIKIFIMMMMLKLLVPL